MARVSVLYIQDEVVGPHLALLRYICEPTSKAVPHVTVRFFNRLAIPPDHLSTSVHYIDLLEPGSFGLESASEQTNKTVYIRCHSDDLLPLEHKPYFPTSEFHITLYDGTSTKFAKSLLALIKKFRWSFRLTFPYEQSLNEIQIRKKKRIRLASRTEAVTSPSERHYSPQLESLFFDATGRVLTFEFLKGLSDAKRLRLASQVCEHLAPFVNTLPPVLLPTRSRQESASRISGKGPHEVHLTPPELAISIAKYAISFTDPKLRIDFGDPAVGTGAFFSALLNTLDNRSLNSAYGIDIDANQAEAARWRWEKKGLKVLKCDYLHMERLPSRNLILANPPYLRHQEIPSEYKLELRQRASIILGEKINALAGQYVYFLVLSHQWMRDGALAAWLIPSEFMQTKYGEALRHYLTQKVTLLRIHQYSHDDPQFENARVLPSVVVFRNELPTHSQAALLTTGGTLEMPTVAQRVDIETLGNLLKWSIPTRKITTPALKSARLGDLFEVRRGIATGANQFFILKRFVAKNLGIPASCLRPVLPKARYLQSDIVEAESDGYPNIEEQLCLVDSSMPEEQIAKRYPRFLSYLRKGIKEGLLDRTLIKSRKLWYKQEHRDPAPFLCTYMGRAHEGKPAIRFIWNKSAAVATNTYLMLYPRPELAKLFRDRPSTTKELFNALKVAASSSLLEMSRAHADGLSKIEPGDLLEVRIGPLSNSICQTVDQQLL